MNSMQKSKRSSHFHFLAPHHNAGKQFKKASEEETKKKKKLKLGYLQTRQDETRFVQSVARE